MGMRRQLGLWISLGAASLLLITLAAKAFVPKPVQQAAAARAMTTGASSDRIRFSDSDQQQLRLGDGSTRVVRSLLQVPNRMQFGEFVWNDAGVPPGRIWLRIDLSRQILSVFRGEEEIATSVVLYGQDETPTPIGNFPIRGMERNHRSNTYDAMMPFTLWLTSDGVAIHGSNVRQGLATHGCIGVPQEFAKRLFGVVKRGDLVSVVR